MTSHSILKYYISYLLDLIGFCLVSFRLNVDDLLNTSLKYMK